MMCSGFFLFITMWVFLYGWRLGRNAHHSHRNHSLCRAWQSLHPENKKQKKKKTYPLDKKNERNMEWFLGLKPRTTWTGMRGCGHILSAQDLSARLCGASETWGLSYMKFPWHPYLYLQKKNKMRREVCCLAVGPSTVQPVVIVCCCLPLCP